MSEPSEQAMSEPSGTSDKEVVERSTPAAAPAEQPATQSIVAQAIDKTTQESINHIDRLIAELEGMKAFIKEDAERVKKEMEQHLAVRRTAQDLIDKVKGEMGIHNNRLHSRT